VPAGFVVVGMARPAGFWGLWLWVRGAARRGRRGGGVRTGVDIRWALPCAVGCGLGFAGELGVVLG